MPHQWWTFSTYHHLVITGGSNDKDVKTVTYAPDGVNFLVEALPSLPKKKTGHCIVALDGDELFVTGKNVVFMYCT